MTAPPIKRRESPVKRINPSGKTVWKARWTDPDGHRLSAGTFTTKREAQAAIDAAYEKQATPAAEIPDAVGSYLEAWLVRYPRTERTNRTNAGRIRRVLAVKAEGRALADWPLRDLRRRHALELVDHMLREQGRASTGATNILRSLSAMAEDAITDELCDVNPFKGVRVRGNDPRATKARKQPTVLSWEQMHAFARAAGEHEPMIRMLADCGLRIGELFALRRAAQDLKAGVFAVTGSAWEGEIMQDSREKRHDRVGPIAPGALALLRAMPARIDTPWLFPTQTGKLWRINNFYRDVWRPAKAASGIDCTPHDFRHSWVSNLAGAGLDEADLADVAGHGLEVQGRYRHALHRSFDAIRGEIG
jgi:integrase